VLSLPVLSLMLLISIVPPRSPCSCFAACSIVKLGLSKCYSLSAFSIALLGEKGYLGSSGFYRCKSFFHQRQFCSLF
jgi:hypothetical protein